MLEHGRRCGARKAAIGDSAGTRRRRSDSASRAVTAARPPSPRVREYFPETMLWQPALITDDKGVADLAVNFADSITTWRLSASANSRGGALGGATVPLKVFQDFFVDIDLPRQPDPERRGRLPGRRLQLSQDSANREDRAARGALVRPAWTRPASPASSTSSPTRSPPSSSASGPSSIGSQPLTVKAMRHQAVRRRQAHRRGRARRPEGREGRHATGSPARSSQTIDIPPTPCPTPRSCWCKIYPGVMAQVVEGSTACCACPRLLRADLVLGVSRTC